MTDRPPKFEELESRLGVSIHAESFTLAQALGRNYRFPIKLALTQHLGENRNRAESGAFVYRLGRKILILERGVRLP